jgi:hypothetical protein
MLVDSISETTYTLVSGDFMLITIHTMSLMGMRAGLPCLGLCFATHVLPGSLDRLVPTAVN